MNSGQRNIQTDRLAAGISNRQIEKLEILSMDLEDLKQFIDSEQLSNPMIEVSDYSIPGAERSSAAIVRDGDDSAGELYDMSDHEAIELSDYLATQLSEKELAKKQKADIVRIIELLDNETGYLMGSDEEIEEETGLSPDRIRFAVQYIRRLDPAGVGARDLVDCLCLQLEQTGELDEFMERILREHMPDIASGRFSKISRELNIPTARVREYIAKIRSLDPRPASRFGKANTTYVIPDVKAVYEDGKWVIQILGMGRSCIHMNKTYENLAREAKDPEVIAYFAEKITRAKEILTAIEHREDTIREMLQIVLETQTEYALGKGELKHLTQKEVAEKLGTHPSTVNRAAKNKYILLPGGTMEIRRLFSAKTAKKPGKQPVSGGNARRSSVAAPQDIKENDRNAVTEICLIAPTRELLELNRKVCEHYDKKVDGYLGSVTRKAIDVAKALQERGAKIFISRRGTKKILEEADLTVVEIPRVFSDYTPVMERAQMAKGRVAFFSYGVPSSEIRDLCMLLGLDAAFYSYYDVEECGNCVARAIEDGAVLGIGGADTAYPAELAGLEYLTIENSEEALLSAIESAEQLLTVMNEEQKRQQELKIRLERYEMIFGFTHDAIIGVNREGRIEVLNREAEKFFPMTGKAIIGSELSKILPQVDITKVLKTGNREIDQLIRINNNTISMNCVPIIAEGKLYGAVATFQDVRTLQKNEQKIRIKMNEKGLTAHYHFEDIRGSSEEVRAAVRIARKFANSNATVMIHGETGTGKEMFAQSIHNASLRASGPFVAINCGSLPKDILEAELFGYVEGAFTGALKGGKMGLFEMAHGGTIFLDEIGEMPLATQVQMLRVLQEKEIRRVGSDKVTPIDIRVIAATHRDLAEAVRIGAFREDLYYRLNILNLDIPPLRRRGNDLQEIALSIYRGLGEHDERDEKEIKGILAELADYTWPGNIRELANMMERFYVLRSQGESFAFIREFNTVAGVTDTEQKATDPNAFQGSVPSGDIEKMQLLPDNPKEKREKQRIIEALDQNDREITKTAENLGMSRSTLWRKMKKYGISV